MLTMKVIKSLLLLLSALFIVYGAKWSPLRNPELDSAWEKWKSIYDKKYSEGLENDRRIIWEENVNKIQMHNIQYDLGKFKYWLGINEFADLTHREFSTLYLRPMATKKTKDIPYFAPSDDEDLPDTVNWVKKGYVTKVKNQGQCGSCWAFSTTGSMEGQQFRKTKKLTSLSEQQLVDCSQSFGNEGCNGGLMDLAFQYIMQFGLEKESAYPYTAQDGSCDYNKRKVVSKCKNFKDVISGSEKDLKRAVALVGPISVAIDASHNSFQFYKGGVYDEENCSSTDLDHGVLAVGYGVDDDSGEKYWLVKNSWGASWGMKGYIMMSKDKDNQCGIATMASYPIM